MKFWNGCLGMERKFNSRVANIVCDSLTAIWRYDGQKIALVAL